MRLLIDISEFLVAPIKTGIQRITGELCRHFPSEGVVPVRLHQGCLLALPSELIGVIGKYFGTSGDLGVSDIFRLGSPEQGLPIRLESNATLLVPEIFNSERARFYENMPPEQRRQCRFIVYDLLPLTHPEFFSHWAPTEMFPYYRAIRDADACGFISNATREVYYGRLKRTSERGGIVLPLGSDSLGQRAVEPSLNRPLIFTVLGTLEPRKNHALILEAFEPLLRDLPGLKLRFVGKVGWLDRKLVVKVREMAADPNSGLELLSARGDREIRTYIEQSRATIYVSTAEGYGLPPVESLWAGTPVIASSTIPSLEDMDRAGVEIVNPLSVVNLRRAILAFVDNAYANRKTLETTTLDLPTWELFTDRVIAWCSEPVIPSVWPASEATGGLLLQ